MDCRSHAVTHFHIVYITLHETAIVWFEPTSSPQKVCAHLLRKFLTNLDMQ